MTVAADLETVWTSKEQADDAFVARAALENVTNTIEQTHQQIQAIVDAGNFNTIPVDLRTALNAWWTVVKTARTSIGGNADIMTIFNWRPTP